MLVIDIKFIKNCSNVVLFAGTIEIICDQAIFITVHFSENPL